MKRYLWFVPLLLIAMVGCGEDRTANVATPEEIQQKEILIILPSIPEVYCYSDQMTDILDELAADFNETDSQVLSVSHSVSCADYGFVNCEMVDLGIGENNKKTAVIECLSNDKQRACLYLLGNEYRDAEGNTFESTCIQGMNQQ